MGQQSASALEVRGRENKGGFGKNRQVKADTGQTARGNPQARAAHSGQQGKPLEKKAEWVDRSKTWEVRCEELGMPEWERRAGPSHNVAMGRFMAGALDHDNARPLAFGKTAVLEIREPGNSRVYRLELTGEVHFNYRAKLL